MHAHTSASGVPSRGALTWMSRRPWWLWVVVVLVGATAAVGLYYRHQIVSLATHRKGPPPSTTAVVPFPAGGRPDVRIAAVGDVGEGEEEEWNTARAMTMLERGNPAYDALLLLGDNVYPTVIPSGCRTPSSARSATCSTTARSSLAILGNHDVAGGWR